ncbi:transcription activator MBF2 domain-containing protein [Phthorimaea operculella]|nr:transcription activator MBF2 domain-containing protein [Phthorimaea operculella]
MAALNFFAIIFVFFVLVNSHDLYLGYPDVGSRLIYNKVHQENPAIWVRYDIFTVNCSSNEVISAINIKDLRDDKWGEAHIKKGGIGERYVTIELDSPSVFRGFNFWVEVYAIQTNAFMFSHGKK